MFAIASEDRIVVIFAQTVAATTQAEPTGALMPSDVFVWYSSVIL
jgi:hypothetical protein